MATKVIMNMSDDELALVENLRSAFGMVTNTATVGQSLRIAAFLVNGLKRGKQIAFLDQDGQPESKIVIPGF